MKKTVNEMNFKDKKVLLRVDFNVPLNENCEITDKRRIIEALPTIKHILSKDGKLIVCSHMGRPDGAVNLKYSLLPVAKILVELLHCKIIFAKDTVGPDAVKKANNLKSGELLLLENVRFHKDEELNGAEFSKKLAALADIFVNDAFATAHRKHASTYGVAKLLPNCLGLLMGKECNIMEQVLKAPERPFVAILGGAKITDKIQVVRNLLPRVDTLIIGGGMAYTFIKANGGNVGKSLVDEENLEFAKSMFEKAEALGVKILLPTDSIIASEYHPAAPGKKCNSYNIPSDAMGLDIGPKAIRAFCKTIKRARTIVWNGPVGVFEFMNFGEGTRKVASTIAKVKGTTIVGGGDTGAAMKMLHLDEKVTHLSTGGGASLKLLEGLDLPCVSIISDMD